MTDTITFTIQTRKDKDGTYKGGIEALGIFHKDMESLGDLIDECVRDTMNLLNGAAQGQGHLEGKRFSLTGTVAQVKLNLEIEVSQNRSLEDFFKARREERIKADPERGIRCGDCRRAPGCPEIGDISICQDFLPHDDVICCGTCYKFIECAKNNGQTWQRPCGEYGAADKPMED